MGRRRFLSFSLFLTHTHSSHTQLIMEVMRSLLCVCQSIDPGQQFTWEHSNLELNKPKNRYANVIAYDHSRVILAAVDGE